jgi:hypothetical protein
MRVVVATLALSLAGLALQRRRPSPGLLPLTATALAGVALWFLGAPDPRFGLAYLFALAFLPACEVLARILETRWRRWVAAGAVAAALAASAGLALEPPEWTRYLSDAQFTLLEWPPTPPGTLFTRERETLPGLRVRVPFVSDQCWDAPLPCTPYFDPGLSNDGMFRTAKAGPGGT